jgi:hypothetical protein
VFAKNRVEARTKQTLESPISGHLTWAPSEITFRNEAKVKAVPLHAMEALGGKRYSSYLFLISAVDGGEWSVFRPCETKSNMIMWKELGILIF